MSEFKTECPGCGQRLLLEDAWRGRNLPCPTCGQIMAIPQQPPVSAPIQSQSVRPPAPRIDPKRATARRGPSNPVGLAVAPILCFLLFHLASRWIGLLSLGFPLAGVICGHLALRNLERSNPASRGAGWAKLGLALCYVVLAVAVLAGVPAFLRAYRLARGL